MINWDKKIEIFTRNVLRLLLIITIVVMFGFLFLKICNLTDAPFIHVFIPIAFFYVAVVFLAIGIYLYLIIQDYLHERRKKKLIKSIQNIRKTIDDIENSFNKNNINFDYALEAIKRYKINTVDDFRQAIDQIEKEKCAIKND